MFADHYFTITNVSHGSKSKKIGQRNFACVYVNMKNGQNEEKRSETERDEPNEDS